MNVIEHGLFGIKNIYDHEHEWVANEARSYCWCQAVAENTPPAPPKPKEPLLNKTVRELIYNQRAKHEKNIERYESNLAQANKEAAAWETSIAAEKAAIAELDEALDLEITDAPAPA